MANEPDPVRMVNISPAGMELAAIIRLFAANVLTDVRKPRQDAARELLFSIVDAAFVLGAHHQQRGPEYREMVRDLDTKSHATS